MLPVRGAGSIDRVYRHQPAASWKSEVSGGWLEQRSDGEMTAAPPGLCNECNNAAPSTTL